MCSSACTVRLISRERARPTAASAFGYREAGTTVKGQPDPAGGLRSRELEAKLIAPDELRLPDLSGLVKGATAVRLPGRHLEATYYDTAELRLARNGITLRYRSGEDGPPWTVKLPEGSSAAALRRDRKSVV